jgi:hypothetical protein
MPSVAPWTCDTCKKPIEAVGHGVIEWLTRESDTAIPFARGLRLVHGDAYSPRRPNSGCQYDESKLDEELLWAYGDLRHFLGHDGLMALLELTARAKFKSYAGLHEMIKRLHIPGFEQARGSFKAANDNCVIKVEGPSGYYTKNQINATLRWLSEP